MMPKNVELHMEDPEAPMMEFKTNDGRSVALNLKKVAELYLHESTVAQVLNVWLEEQTS